MRQDLLEKYAKPVPRYTSYPTAPHFSTVVGPEDYRRWLGAIAPDESVSVYVHIPFCDKLCWYCGCNTKATERYKPVADYFGSLMQETETVAEALGRRPRATHIAWGGGSPSILSAADIHRLARRLGDVFDLASDAELAAEIDPRILDDDKIRAFAAAGINRISIGVQDFSEEVQRAINREQGYELTARAVEGFRREGIGSINIDLVYGLPRQTRASVERTIDQVIGLKPDRIALFGYAHLPSRLPHQRMIKDAELPDTLERFAQSSRAAEQLVAAGYVRIGLDHFARPGDSMALRPVRRNFQGYTTDTATTLIGLGASAIGRFEQGYVQNVVPTAEYRRRVASGGLATARGRALSEDDRVRGWAIEHIICDLRLSAPDLKQHFGAAALPVIATARNVLAEDRDGLIAAEGDDGSFRVTDTGRHFVRSICASFDAYLGQGAATHSSGV